ncbi:MAG: hypothetical protein JST75_20755 [Bacteroidetes bacterium]|nr:hypothetical protein [Bacteroidota bacterium]
MERLEYLIGKLKEQFEQNADPLQMLLTVKSIEAELSSQQVPASSSGRSSTKIAVVMPSALKYTPAESSPVSVPSESKKIIEPEKEPAYSRPKQHEWIPDPLIDIPTLSHQPLARELNDVIGHNGSSLNDQLKEDVLELAAALKDSPVRELKKAIGVNDRYVFINELFRGDEAMYERSIKTINNFRILPEAEYWMERELKIKLGWDDSREITRQFYQLVKRRFS